MECDELWPCWDELEEQVRVRALLSTGWVRCGRPSCDWEAPYTAEVDGIKAYSKHIREDHFGHQQAQEAPDQVVAQQGAGEEEQAADAGESEGSEG